MNNSKNSLLSQNTDKSISAPHMFGLIYSLFILLLASCTSNESDLPIRLVITGNLNGAYNSCSCPKGQPGGLARRAKIFDKIRSEPKDGYFVDCGNLYRDRMRDDKRQLLSELIIKLDYDLMWNSDSVDGNLREFHVTNAESVDMAVYNLSEAEDEQWTNDGYEDAFFDRLSRYDLIVLGGGGFIDPHVEQRDSLLVAYPGTYGSHVLVVDLWINSDGKVVRHKWKATPTKGVEPDSLFSKMIGSADKE